MGQYIYVAFLKCSCIMGVRNAIDISAEQMIQRLGVHCHEICVQCSDEGPGAVSELFVLQHNSSPADTFLRCLKALSADLAIFI